MISLLNVDDSWYMMVPMMELCGWRWKNGGAYLSQLVMLRKGVVLLRLKTGTPKRKVSEFEVLRLGVDKDHSVYCCQFIGFIHTGTDSMRLSGSTRIVRLGKEYISQCWNLDDFLTFQQKLISNFNKIWVYTLLYRNSNA